MSQRIGQPAGAQPLQLPLVKIGLLMTQSFRLVM
jgi:hypothetical protein